MVDGSGDGPSNSSAPRATSSKAIQAEFQIVDDSGQVLATQHSDGKVYAPGRHAPLGQIEQFI